MSNSESAVAAAASHIGQSVRADKLKLLFHQSTPALFIALFIGALTAWLVRDEAPRAILWCWMAVLLVMSLLRLGLFAAYFIKRPQGAALLRWERPYLLSLAVASLSWGIGAAVVMSSASLLGQVIVAFFMVGMAGGALSTYSVLRRMAALATLSVLLPGTLWLYWRGDMLGIGLALGSTILMIASLRGIGVNSRALRTSLQLSRELELAHISAEALARTDVLTGLSNRRAFFERGEQIARYCQRNQRPLSLLLLDVDLFKAINDNYGHAAGDAALSAVGELLQQQFRRADVCGRIGGEEFAVLLTDTTLANAAALAEKLRAAIVALPVRFGDQALALTASIGVAAGSYDLDILLSQADAAMYRAKALGRNRVVSG